ncbi:MAG: cupin domain-containing protein [Mycobacterium sp.]
MATFSVKSFDAPDETRTPDKTKLEVVDLGSAKAARMTAQPGWRWSECIKPVVGTESCQARHVGVVVSGRLHVIHDDGSEGELGTGDAYVIEPGHDAWVVGDEVFVGYEFESSTAGSFGQPS